MLNFNDKYWEHVGDININTNKIDITDPCYEKTDRGYMVQTILPGQYRCCVKRKFSDEHVESIAIIQADKPFNECLEQNQGTIGVDAGLAGFFVEKPTYDNKAWSEFCDFLQDSHGLNEVWVNKDPSNAIGCVGFFSQSGYGDGEYEVYSLYRGDQLVGYMIDFDC